jgi:hypothetical protein
MKTVDLIERNNRKVEEINLLAAEYKRQNDKENRSDDEIKKLSEDFYALLKQKKELDEDRKQIIHRILSEYDGSKKQQLE